MVSIINNNDRKNGVNQKAGRKMHCSHLAIFISLLVTMMIHTNICDKNMRFVKSVDDFIGTDFTKRMFLSHMLVCMRNTSISKDTIFYTYNLGKICIFWEKLIFWYFTPFDLQNIFLDVQKKIIDSSVVINLANFHSQKQYS